MNNIRKISQGNSIRGEYGTVSLLFCIKMQVYSGVCQSKLLAISVWRFIMNVHDIRILTVVFKLLRTE